MTASTLQGPLDYIYDQMLEYWGALPRPLANSVAHDLSFEYPEYIEEIEGVDFLEFRDKVDAKNLYFALCSLSSSNCIYYLGGVYLLFIDAVLGVNDRPMKSSLSVSPHDLLSSCGGFLTLYLGGQWALDKLLHASPEVRGFTAKIILIMDSLYTYGLNEVSSKSRLKLRGAYKKLA